MPFATFVGRVRSDFIEMSRLELTLAQASPFWHGSYINDPDFRPPHILVARDTAPHRRS